MNAFLFVLLILSIYHLTSHKKLATFLLFFAIPTLLWLYMPAYGQIFLWLDGSINYMWGYLFALLFLSVYITLLRGKSPVKPNLEVDPVLCIYIPFGNYSENVSFSVIFTGFLLLCITMYRQKSIRKFLFIFFRLHVGLLDI